MISIPLETTTAISSFTQFITLAQWKYISVWEAGEEFWAVQHLHEDSIEYCILPLHLLDTEYVIIHNSLLDREDNPYHEAQDEQQY